MLQSEKLSLQKTFTTKNGSFETLIMPLLDTWNYKSLKLKQILFQIWPKKEQRKQFPRQKKLAPKFFQNLFSTVVVYSYMIHGGGNQSCFFALTIKTLPLVS